MQAVPPVSPFQEVKRGRSEAQAGLKTEGSEGRKGGKPLTTNVNVK